MSIRQLHGRHQLPVLSRDTRPTTVKDALKAGRPANRPWLAVQQLQPNC